MRIGTGAGVIQPALGRSGYNLHVPDPFIPAILPVPPVICHLSVPDTNLPSFTVEFP